MKIKTKIIFVVSSLLLVSCLLFLFVWQGIYLPKNPLGKEKIFAIGKGEGVREISFHLEKEGLIKSRLFFRIYVLSKDVSRNLRAGNYSVSPSMTIPEIAKKIVLGDVAKIIMTIPEGFTVKQIEERLNLKLSGENLEGFLFPDTYYFPIDVTGEEVVRIMRNNFEKKLNTKIPELGLTPKEAIMQQGKTIFEIVTMASMLEKEVKTFEDKKIVSSILWKRREHGWPLQVDATLTYITGKKSSELTKEDLESPSPYNTYKYSWIPGPICNPGLDSILAAIYPEKSDFWYYLSTPDGKTIFSRTLQEHNLAKAKYLK